MTNLHAAFAAYVKQNIWPEFKQLGYKKSGNNFRFYNSSGWGKMLQFQFSHWNSEQEARFTVNVSFYLPEVAQYLLKREPGATFSEHICIVRKRLGNLKPAKRDEWYTIQEGVDPTPVFAQLSADITQYALPFLATVDSQEDIFSILAGGYKSYYIPAQINAMYRAGYHEAAIRMLADDLARTNLNEHYQATLLKLAQELGIQLAA
ncbi:DUF4304 domain-containing protein [Hymenobacter sp. ASUV-10]|uniref:DUF4304 domain-containing protein n=1 Tax=Hymenobacter aranciens TaxID=3063996 RepID=A0ABT9BFW1_9BACT|nr:DUF4304 domain-containing protein [Hymenobacter sp. ASUV-10]MDO7876548.1 DUF4304 domain-containing protein [Hymenobacter sp. ASUV-10]